MNGKGEMLIYIRWIHDPVGLGFWIGGDAHPFVFKIEPIWDR
jgi:hypothetical protein